MHLALIKYSALRLALFVGSLIVLGLLGAGGILLLLLAALMSLALSYLLLGKQRDELAQALVQRTQARLDAHSQLGQTDAAAEDAAVDASERKTDR